VTARGLIIGAPASGSGKTVVTLALLRALANAGVRIASFKVGPDYIDPAFHAAATGRTAYNLDLWAMRPATIGRLLAAIQDDAELVIGEGVMGLFDGAAEPQDGVAARAGTGSTAEVAARTGWPVVLVVDVRGQAASAAAVLRGFATHRDDVAIAGVVFNRVGGAAHAEMLRRAVMPLGIPVVGCLPRTDALAIPERHLGLVQAGEQRQLNEFLEGAERVAGRHLDLARVLDLARPASCRPSDDDRPALAPLGQRMAVARDLAFSFVYPSLLDGWRGAGAELAFFSPLADEAPPADADAVYLPGGYPELHAGRLSANASFLAGLRRAAARGAAVFGECGGYMVLGEGLTDADGRRHAMAGLLPLETSFAERRLHLGYRRVDLLEDGPLGPRGTAFRGHEFHYATVVDQGPGDGLFRCSDAARRDLGTAGQRRGRVCGSFVHLIDRSGQADEPAAA
jgi:cobyrinic acid a,c-diamide synthase